MKVRSFIAISIEFHVCHRHSRSPADNGGRRLASATSKSLFTI